MTVTEQTRKILARDREARNIDKHFEIVFLQERGMNLTPQQIETWMEMPDIWTARRAKQILQSEKQGEEQYRADPAVRKMKKHKSLEVTQNAPQASPERLERVIEQHTQVPMFEVPTNRVRRNMG